MARGERSVPPGARAAARKCASAGVARTSKATKEQLLDALAAGRRKRDLALMPPPAPKAGTVSTSTGSGQPGRECCWSTADEAEFQIKLEKEFLKVGANTNVWAWALGLAWGWMPKAG